MSADGYIVSGHRRWMACALAGLTEVPVQVLDLCRSVDPNGFVRLLREHNRQREKSNAERLKEALVDVDPEDAYDLVSASNIPFDLEDLDACANRIQIAGANRRSGISGFKRPMAEAVKRVLVARRKYWPLSDRQIHYALLNDPPQRGRAATGPYRNDAASYKDLTDLLTRLRLCGEVPMDAIDDDTRPVETWDPFSETSLFLKSEIESLFLGYRRDLQQSQPDHIEIVGEKNTILSTIRPVAWEFLIPYTIARGYPSLPPRAKIAERFRRSGKSRLVLLVLSDHDPEGCDIPHALTRSLRDDFGVSEIQANKVAITPEQVEAYGLLPALEAKASSARYKAFIESHGTNVYELEALTPEQLQEALRRAVLATIDVHRFEEEKAAMKNDCRFLRGVRNLVTASLKDIPLTAEEH